MDTQVSSPDAATIPAAESINYTSQRHSKKIVLIILGILELPFPAVALYALLPLLELQNTLEINTLIPYIGLIFFIFALIVALSQIVIGFLSYDLTLGDKRTKILIITGLFTAVLTIPLIIMTIIMPIYSTVDVLK